MLIAIVNGQTVEQVGDYQVLFPNTSFPSSGPTPEWMAENSCLPVTVYLPYDPATQYLESVAPYINAGVVYTVQVAQMTPEMIAQYQAGIAAQIGAQAAALLSATDWTTIPSVADPAQSNPYLTNQAEFIAWRSQVRAIAVTPTYTSIIPPQPKDTWSNQPAPTPTGSTTINVGTSSTTVNAGTASTTITA
jgi:hypothetical protein